MPTKEIMNDNETQPSVAEPMEPSAQNVPIQWDRTDMTISFSNVINLRSTVDQVDFFFGLNYGQSENEDGPVKIKISNHIMMTPHAAKRFLNALQNVIDQYEGQHGKLKLDRI